MTNRTFSIVVEMAVDSAVKSSKSLVKSLGGVDKAFKTIGKGAASTKRLLGDLFSSTAKLAGIAGASIGAVVATFKKFSDQGDQIAKTADKLGLTTEALVGLRHAANQTGASTGVLDTSLQRMTRRISEATQGTGVAVKALSQLGIPIKDIAQLAPDEQFRRITEAMAGVESQSDKVRLAMALFDTEGVALVNTMKLGTEGLDAMAAEAEALGISLDRVEAAKLEQANDALANVGNIATGAGQQFAINLAPAIEAVSKQLTGAVIEAGGFGDVMASVVDVGVRGFAKLLDVLAAMKAIWPAIKSIALESWAAVLRTLVEVDSAVTSFLNKIPGVTATTSSTITNVSDTLTKMANEATNAFMQIDLSPGDKLLESYEKFKVASAERAEVTAAETEALQKLNRETEVTIVNKEKEKAAEKAAKDAAKEAAKEEAEAKRTAAKALAELEREQQRFRDTQKGIFDDLGKNMADWASSTEQAVQQVIGNFIQLAAMRLFDTGSMGSSFFSGFGSAFGGAFAEGGTFTGGKPILVGEKGPEIITPTTSGTVIPNDQLMANQQVSLAPQFIVQGNVNGVDDLEQRFSEFSNVMTGEIRNMIITNKRTNGVFA